MESILPLPEGLRAVRMPCVEKRKRSAASEAAAILGALGGKAGKGTAIRKKVASRAAHVRWAKWRREHKEKRQAELAKRPK